MFSEDMIWEGEVEKKRRQQKEDLIFENLKYIEGI